MDDESTSFLGRAGTERLPSHGTVSMPFEATATLGATVASDVILRDNVLK